MSAIAIKVLAVAGSGVGIALLGLPQSTARMCLLPAAASSSLILRLAGSRDFALGALLWSASASAPPSTSASADSGKDSILGLRQALIAGALVDAIDLVSVGACFADGSLALESAVLVGAGAALFLGLGLVGLRSSRFAQDGYTQIK